MESLRLDQTAIEIQKRIEQHETALGLLPEGKVKERLLAEVARLRSIQEMKRLVAD
jgi:hypothetical protein